MKVRIREGLHPDVVNPFDTNGRFDAFCWEENAELIVVETDFVSSLRQAEKLSVLLLEHPVLANAAIFNLPTGVTMGIRNEDLEIVKVSIFGSAIRRHQVCICAYMLEETP